jgi:hypothetical protein
MLLQASKKKIIKIALARMLLRMDRKRTTKIVLETTVHAKMLLNERLRKGKTARRKSLKIKSV